jgi:hypothetical protein
MRQIVLVLSLILGPLALLGQSSPQPDPPHRDWHASWITHPTAPLREPLVLHFRRTLRLDTIPASYPVRVSADNRFILFVNGRLIGDGPARGDLSHWRYERFELAPFLQAGSNLITATVWNFGILSPVAQMSDRTAFLLESEATGPASISTPDGWLVEQEPGQTPLPRSTLSYITYYAAGPGEQTDAAKYDSDWNSPAAPGPSWVTPGDPMRDSAFPGTNRAHSADTTGDNPWALVPDELPPMEYAPTTVGEIASIDLIGAEQPGLAKFPASPASLPPGVHVHILLDRDALTTAYPSLTVSGGKGSKIVLTYSEALYDDNQHKGDRDSRSYTSSNGIEHPRDALGLTDSFLPDGGAHRTFMPLWWRTWRYLDIDITTADAPLTLESLTANFTAYPFTERATFDATTPASDPTLSADLAKIWEISWRTARLDAHETYMDTPYYEQLQYIGDTRIQALISYTVANDDRLARQAIAAFNDSRSPEGLTRSRYPSSLPQTIPTFSLLYIGMLHDYWMYRPDPKPVRELLPATRSVLAWFAAHENPDGLLGKLPYWSFIDWVGDKQEIPTYSAGGESCVTTLEYLGALNDAADLEHALGEPSLALSDHSRAEHVRSGLYKACWNSQLGMIADNPDHKIFSQQANILGVLYDVVPKVEQQPLLMHLLTIDPGTTPDGILSASYYFRFYLARALDHAGLADNYLPSLDPWRKLLPLHFTTWPETPGDTRSDSHAWSAHPIYDLLTLVAGVEPASPGFATVRIAPHLGSLRSLSATFPHPLGAIKVAYTCAPAEPDPHVKGGSTFQAVITLPRALTGVFEFNGETRALVPGINRIDVPMK